MRGHRHDRLHSHLTTANARTTKATCLLSSLTQRSIREGPVHVRRKEMIEYRTMANQRMRERPIFGSRIRRPTASGRPISGVSALLSPKINNISSFLITNISYDNKGCHSCQLNKLSGVSSASSSSKNIYLIQDLIFMLVEFLLSTVVWSIVLVSAEGDQCNKELPFWCPPHARSPVSH
jgi:hypothetical protein